jgi:phage tail tape-measure protein
MKQLARIIKNCGHRGKVGQVYEIIETNPREGFRLIMPGETQFSFWYPKDCIEEVQPGACTVPTTDPVSWAENAKAFDEMAKFAARVPFSLEQIQQGSGVLATVAKDANELAHLMEITGNVAAVTGLDFQTTSSQIQRSMSAGIGAADLFREKGVRAMLGFQAGAEVSIEETIAAFNKVFGKGGKFGNATKELAKTFEGTLSMIGDKIFTFKKTLLDAGFFTELKKQFGDLDKFLVQNSESIERIAIGFGTVLAKAVKGIADFFVLLKDNINLVITALKVLIAVKIVAFFISLGSL